MASVGRLVLLVATPWAWWHPELPRSHGLLHHPSRPTVLRQKTICSYCRHDDCRAELHNLLKEERLAEALLLVFTNKQVIQVALKHAEISKVLDMTAMQKSHHWQTVGYSAFADDGLGFNWLVRLTHLYP